MNGTTGINTCADMPFDLAKLMNISQKNISKSSKFQVSSHSITKTIDRLNSQEPKLSVARVSDGNMYQNLGRNFDLFREIQNRMG